MQNDVRTKAATSFIQPGRNAHSQSRVQSALQTRELFAIVDVVAARRLVTRRLRKSDENLSGRPPNSLSRIVMIVGVLRVLQPKTAWKHHLRY
jgi:hypothetical protein